MARLAGTVVALAAFALSALSGCQTHHPPAAPTSTAASESSHVTLGPLTPSSAPIPALGPVPLPGLCVTRGTIAALPSGRLSVTCDKMRAVVAVSTSQSVELHFDYVGPSVEVSALGSVEIRRQVGVKLRAQDSCNVIYAMWRIEPESKLVVSVKRNPGMTTSAECGTHGYTNIKPQSSAPVPLIVPGSSHVLRAELDGSSLLVLADGATVWQGELPTSASDFDGPVGVRSDNVHLELDLLAGPPQPGGATTTSHCVVGSSEESE